MCWHILFKKKTFLRAGLEVFNFINERSTVFFLGNWILDSEIFVWIIDHW